MNSVMSAPTDNESESTEQNDPFARFREAGPMTPEQQRDWDDIVRPGTPG